MSPSNPGRKVVRKYSPPHLRRALYVTRLANASNVRVGMPDFRYVLNAPIHEAIDTDSDIRIFDSYLGVEVSYQELLDTLPEDLQKHVLYS